MEIVRSKCFHSRLENTSELLPPFDLSDESILAELQNVRHVKTFLKEDVVAALNELYFSKKWNKIRAFPKATLRERSQDLSVPLKIRAITRYLSNDVIFSELSNRRLSTLFDGLTFPEVINTESRRSVVHKTDEWGGYLNGQLQRDESALLVNARSKFVSKYFGRGNQRFVSLTVDFLDKCKEYMNK